MERNAIWHGEAGRSIDQSIKWALDTTMDLRHVGKDKAAKPIRAAPWWKSPYHGAVKLNVDAAFRLDNGEGATACVVRDSSGSLIRAQAIWYEFGSSSLIMEAEALRDGVRLALDMGLQIIVMDTDALEVVNDLERIWH
jgi:hypothetical protein